MQIALYQFSNCTMDCRYLREALFFSRLCNISLQVYTAMYLAGSLMLDVQPAAHFSRTQGMGTHFLPIVSK